MIVSFNIPNAFAVRIGDAISAGGGYYDPAIHGTKVEYLRLITIRMWKERVLAYEAGIAKAGMETEVGGIDIT